MREAAFKAEGPVVSEVNVGCEDSIVVSLVTCVEGAVGAARDRRAGGTEDVIPMRLGGGPVLNVANPPIGAGMPCPGISRGVILWICGATVAEVWKLSICEVGLLSETGGAPALGCVSR